jgi:RNA polymerase sigma factor (sigma-70 family)
MPATDISKAIETVWKIERAKLIAGVTRLVRDVGVAEELAQDALVAALEQWPATGIPDKPGAWLMAAAKNKGLDRLRRAKLMERKHAEIGRGMEEDEQTVPDYETALDDDIGDDLLRLIFTSCHPVLSTDARLALTLRLLAGLTTEEIARAFLVPEPTISQRIVRAKKTLAEKRIPFEVPRGEERAERLASVLEVIYLIFNEGYTATSGETWIRPQLCEEALRLGRILAGLSNEPEVHGLVALLEIQASRLAARVSPSGEPILLLEQDRARWDRLLIRRGLAALEKARAECVRQQVLAGPYLLQAEIAACHARARTAEETDWGRIVALYSALGEATPSPIIELNRAVAVSMAFGPAAALELVDQLADAPALKNYHLLPSVRGDLLAKLDRHSEAKAEFEQAAALTRNGRERDLLLGRAAAMQKAAAPH